MSQNDRARHLNSFVADSYPPPMAQHLPPMPSAANRFTSAMQKQQDQMNFEQQRAIAQQLQQQKRMPLNANQFNYVDPFQAGEFNPFESFVLNDVAHTNAQKDSDSDSDDSTTDSSTDATTTREDVAVKETEKAKQIEKVKQKSEKPKTPQKLVAPATTAAVQPVRPTPPPPPPAAPIQQQPVPIAAAPAVPPLPPAAAKPLPKDTVPNDEPRGIMDQSMAFLKRNFWPILTVLVVLIMIGVAFIYFANRGRADANDKKPTLPAAKPPPPPLREEKWDDEHLSNSQPPEAEAMLRPEGDAMLQSVLEEKQKTEAAYVELQRKLAAVEKQIEKSTNASTEHHTDVIKLQEMCEKLINDRDQLYQEREDLEEKNYQLSQVIIQSGIMDAQGEQEPIIAENTPVGGADITNLQGDDDAEEEAKEGEEEEGAEEGVEEEGEEIDIGSIEKSALPPVQRKFAPIVQVVDDTQTAEQTIQRPFAPIVEVFDHNLESAPKNPEEAMVEDDNVEETEAVQFPWQK